MTMTNLLLLQALYNEAKNSNTTALLNTSKQLTLNGVCNGVQNRVLSLCSSYSSIEDVSFTIECIIEEFESLTVD